MSETEHAANGPRVGHNSAFRRTTKYSATLVSLVQYFVESSVLRVRAATQAFSVPRTTLRDRRAGKPPQRDCQPNSRNLTQREEEVIVSHILSLDQRGFTPTYAAVRDMADKLLAARGVGQVSIH